MPSFVLLGITFCLLVWFFIRITGSGTTKPDQGTTEVDWSQVEDDPAEEISMSWMGPLGFAQAQPGSWIQRNIEERMNLVFDPLFLDPVAYSKTRSLRFIAGEVPDVFWNGDPLGVRAMVLHGFAMEIPLEVILRHAPTYVRYINEQGPEAWMYSQWRGRNWGIPTVVPAGNFPRLILWRMDWLRNVGIDRIPETIEEAHEAFRRFTFDDPDGNGLPDTYGFSPSVAHWSYFFSEFFAAFGILPFDFQEVDGAIVWGGIQPGAEEVLAMLHGWFKEGIIHPDFVLGTAGQATAAFEQGRVGYLGLASINDLNESRPNSLVNRMRRIHPDAEIVAGPALRLEGREPMTRVWGAAAHVVQFSSATKPEKVIRVLRLLEELARDGEFAIEATLGKRGEHWDHDAKSGVRLLEPYSEQLARSEMLSTEAFLMPPFFGLFGLSEEKVASLYSEDQVEALRQVARPEWGLRNALGKSDVLDLSASKLRDLRVLQETRFVDMIRGRRPVASFHDFVDTWKSRGGAEMLREANEFIEQRNKVYREVGVLP